MQIGKKDWRFIALIAAVLGIFIAISGKEKTKPVPFDAAHQVSYEAAFRKAPGPDASIFARAFFKPDKKAAEVGCESCHLEKKVKFPPNHPQKDRCLFCHKLKKPGL